jgi:hypothetical protein
MMVFECDLLSNKTYGIEYGYLCTIEKDIPRSRLELKRKLVLTKDDVQMSENFMKLNEADLKICRL